MTGHAFSRLPSAVSKHTSASALSPLMVCSLPPWLGPPLPQWRCICTAVNSHGSPISPIHSGSSITADGEDTETRVDSLRQGAHTMTTQNLKTLTNWRVKDLLPGYNWWQWPYKQVTRKAAWIPGREQLVAIFTCVSIIVQSEGLVSMLAVSQWGQRDQTGVILSLRGYHINGGLRSTTAFREILRPLGLAHQAFDRRTTETIMSPNNPVILWKASLIDCL